MDHSVDYGAQVAAEANNKSAIGKFAVSQMDLAARTDEHRGHPCETEAVEVAVVDLPTDSFASASLPPGEFFATGERGVHLFVGGLGGDGYRPCYAVIGLPFVASLLTASVVVDPVHLVALIAKQCSHVVGLSSSRCSRDPGAIPMPQRDTGSP